MLKNTCIQSHKLTHTHVHKQSSKHTNMYTIKYTHTHLSDCISSGGCSRLKNKKQQEGLYSSPQASRQNGYAKTVICRFDQHHETMNQECFLVFIYFIFLCIYVSLETDMTYISIQTRMGMNTEVCMLYICHFKDLLHMYV